MYDEYWADRKALTIADSLFPEKSTSYQTYVQEGVKGFLRMLADDSDAHDLVKREISKFRWHGDVNRFLWAIDETFDGLLKALAHGYAYIDHFPEFQEEETVLRTSKFLDNRAKHLIEFIRSKYDEDSVDLLDGIPLIEAFIGNFGMRFEVLPSGGIYCHVLDI